MATARVTVSPEPSGKPLLPTPPSATRPVEFVVGYTAPRGWQVSLQDADQVELIDGSDGEVREEIRLAVDIAVEQTGTLPVTTVDGHRTYVVSDATVGATEFDETLIIIDSDRHFIFTCDGFTGYSPTGLQSACQQFLGSLRFP